MQRQSVTRSRSFMREPPATIAPPMHVLIILKRWKLNTTHSSPKCHWRSGTTSILVRLSLGKYQEQVLKAPEAKVPVEIRNLNQKGLRHLELHHQLAFLGSKVYFGHKAVDRSPPDLKAHRLIYQLPLQEIVVQEPNGLSTTVFEKIDSSMVRFGQALSK